MSPGAPDDGRREKERPLQILPNVYLADGFAYASHPNFYLVRGDGVNVLVDSGTVPEDLARAERNLAAWGISLDRIDALLVTHSHYDHMGNAAAIRERGARVYAGPGDAQGIELADNRTAPYAAGFPQQPCKVDRVVEDGEVIEVGGLRFEALHAPGHTSGSIVYQTEVGDRTVWFTGDVLMARGIDYQGELGWQGSEDFSKSAYIESLKRLAALPVDCVLAGHHIPYLRDGHPLGGPQLRPRPGRMALASG